jgi:type II secretory pathway pseudopilin PulG
LKTTAFTLVETLVVIALIAALTVIFLSPLPRAQAVNPDQLAPRLSSALEAAHTQAVAERTALTLTGDGERLVITAPDGAEEERFTNTTLAGTLTIAPDGTTSGALTLTPAGQNCTRHTLTNFGISTTAGCGASSPEGSVPPPVPPTPPISPPPPPPASGPPASGPPVPGTVPPRLDPPGMPVEPRNPVSE